MAEGTVYNYCKALSASEFLSDRVIGWTGRWVMVGSFVMCSHCMAIQQVADACHPFTHEDGCPASKTDQYPWQELAALMSKIRQPVGQRFKKAIR